MMLELLELIVGLIGLFLLFKWLEKGRPDPMNYPQDYMGWIMNERIKDLINQMDRARIPYGINAMTVTDEHLEYFAELIVQECLDECWYDATPKQIADNIRMKFGVEWWCG